jgi:hypothetical protein
VRRLGPPPGSEPGLRDSRVLVLSQRNVQRPLWHTAQYELEDLLTHLDDAVLLAPRAAGPPWVSELARHGFNGAAHRLRLPRRSPPWTKPSMEPCRLTSEHDLFVSVFHTAPELSYMHRVKDWRQRCRKAVCILVELWSPDVADNADYLQVLAQFDEVFVCNPAAATAIEALGLRRPRVLAHGLDAAVFAPGGQPPARVLDCYNYGRSSAAVHARLLELAETVGLTYLYDVLEDSAVSAPSEHRALVANMMKRSKFFFSFRINESPERQGRTGGDEALSTRYFEGVAGGAVVLGSATRSREFEECFDWPDALIPVDFAGSDLREVLDDLSRQDGRLARTRTTNVRNSLLRHDWVYRWQTMLASVGLSPAPQVEERVQRLHALAAAVDLPPEGLDAVLSAADSKRPR